MPKHKLKCHPLPGGPGRGDGLQPFDRAPATPTMTWSLVHWPPRRLLAPASAPLARDWRASPRARSSGMAAAPPSFAPRRRGRASAARTAVAMGWVRPKPALSVLSAPSAPRPGAARPHVADDPVAALLALQRRTRTVPNLGAFALTACRSVQVFFCFEAELRAPLSASRSAPCLAGLDSFDTSAVGLAGALQ
jgi:hypothetical protein